MATRGRKVKSRKKHLLTGRRTGDRGRLRSGAQKIGSRCNLAGKGTGSSGEKRLTLWEIGHGVRGKKRSPSIKKIFLGETKK